MTTLISRKSQSIANLFRTFILSTLFITATHANAATVQISNPTVTPQIFEKAKENTDWKFAYLTGAQAQIVFMNISPATNPKNEIGVETHPFDQIIFIVAGNGEALLNGKSMNVNTGDMIFIPKGTQHNVINLNKNQPLKILSIYSQMDIPANAVYKTKSED